MMKRFVFLFLVNIFVTTVYSQVVIINGIDKNRLLTWEDFTGRPDKKSEHAAMASWKIYYSYQGINFNGDTAMLRGLKINLELDKDRSWLKKGRETGDLLKHEQGHFNVGLLCQQEMLKQFTNTVFLKSGWQDKIQKLFNNILDKYLQMDLKYDTETNHSKQKEMQQKWDSFFSTELNK